MFHNNIVVNLALSQTPYEKAYNVALQCTLTNNVAVTVTWCIF